MHQIQKQIIEIELPENLDAFSWQEKITTICNDILAEKLDNLFNKIGNDSLISFDKIEIDLGIIDVEDFERKFVENIENELFVKLNKVFNQTKEEVQIEKKLLSDDPNTKSSFTAFISFLESGTLPWWVSNDLLSTIDFEIETIFSKNQVEKNTQIIEIKRAIKNRMAIERLVLQFSEKTLWQLINFVYEEEKGTIILFQKFYEILKKASPTQFSQYNFRVLSVEVFTLIFNELKEYKPLTINHLYQKLLFQILPRIFTNKSSFLSFKYSIEEKLHEEFKGKFNSQTFSEIDNFELLDKSKVNDNETIPTQDFKEDTSLKDDGFYIENAGLVLLFPFLKDYLKSCNIADNEQIFEPEDAVHLLQYLVNFQTKTFENQLILNKILCGLPINFPIKKEFEIKDYQQEEAITLLNSVLKHWYVMKNTSIEGLQLSFLQRNGKLSKIDNGWLLQVEQAPFDMLLDELPWSYSVVPLPWMTELLLVEWS